MLAISYRREWEQRCSRSCNCYVDSNGSDFAVKECATMAEAARFFADRLRTDPKAEFINVFAQGEEAEWLNSPCRGVDSIVAGEHSDELRNMVTACLK